MWIANFPQPSIARRVQQRVFGPAVQRECADHLTIDLPKEKENPTDHNWVGVERSRLEVRRMDVSGPLWLLLGVDPRPSGLSDQVLAL